PATGAVRNHRILAASRAFHHPHKIAVSGDGRWIGATGNSQNDDNLMVVSLETGDWHLASIPKEVDAIEPWRDSFIIGANRGVHYRYSPDTRQRLSWNGRTGLYPHGRKPEYISIPPG